MLEAIVYRAVVTWAPGLVVRGTFKTMQDNNIVIKQFRHHVPADCGLCAASALRRAGRI
jgi:hypothetical protein